MTSMSSDVMRPWRARLYCMLRRLIRSPAFSVALFMATMRAICSLTAESRKHLNSLTLKLVGTTSSRMLSGEGRNSYIARRPPLRPVAAVAAELPSPPIAPSGSSVSIDDLLPGNADELRVDDVEPVELAGDVFVQIAAGEHVDFVERRLVFEVRVRLIVGLMPRNLNAAMPRLPTISSRQLGTVCLQLQPAVKAGPLHVAVEAAAQAAIGGEHQQRGVLDRSRALRAADGSLPARWHRSLHQLA